MRVHAPIVAAVLLAAVSFTRGAEPTTWPAQTELRAVDMGMFCPLPRGSAIRARDQLKGDPADLPAGAGLEMVAPRGGRVMAQAVLRGPALAAIAATAPRLTGPGGATLPAGAVTVHWLTGSTRADALAAQPVEKQVQPLLMLVDLPAAAAPGAYSGTLTVTAQGFTGSLKVSLDVMPWTLPPPKEWQTICGVVHSPDTIAMQYKVEPWSDAHLKFMEPSLKLLADLGTKSALVYLVAEGPMYERQSMVRAVEGGGLDFTPMDRYLDLWQKVCGTPTSVTLYIWHNRTRFKALGEDHRFKVTRKKPDGKLENFGVPGLGQAEAVQFWKPVFAGIRERMARRGWKDTELLLGTPYDSRPTEEEIGGFNQVAPGLRWRVFTHGFNTPLPRPDGKLMMSDGGEVGWMEGCETPKHRGPMSPEGNGMFRAAEMKRNYPVTTCARGQLWWHKPLWSWRDVIPGSLQRGCQGFSTLGLDYWNVAPEFAGVNNPGDLSDVRCDSPRHGLPMTITTPGPKGAEPCVRYFMMREGFQASEAYLALRRAGGQGNARAAAAAEAFTEFVKARTDNVYGYIPGGSVLDRDPVTYYHDLYKPNGLRDEIANRRRAHPGRRLVVVACDRANHPDQITPMGAAAGTADAVVLTDWGKPHEDFDGIAAKMRAGIPAGVACEVVRDRQAAIKRARALAGRDGVVVVCSKGNETYAIIDQERSQGSWNSAVRELYKAAAALQVVPSGKQ